MSLSYERRMLAELAMPSRRQVETVLLRAILQHGGVIQEFAQGQQIVDETADALGLNKRQRSAFMQTVYRKENRIKRSRLWHRLLFRAADSLAGQGYLSHPKQTRRLTGRNEWMLTEKGFEKGMRLSGIPIARKGRLAIKSYEVQRVAKELTESRRPANYNPVDATKETTRETRMALVRIRGFRQAVIEAYSFSCAVCGLRINSPDSLTWEVAAAHVVPHNMMGRDDIWNGIALCRLHHWAFDVGWLTLLDDYVIKVSSQVGFLPTEYGRLGEHEFLRALTKKTTRALLPEDCQFHPHRNAILWHRQNVFSP